MTALLCMKATVHLKGKTECFECSRRPAAKGFPICTIRNTPEKPIHCIVWAKDLLFERLFGPVEAANDMDEAPQEEEGNTDAVTLADAGLLPRLYHGTLIPTLSSVSPSFLGLCNASHRWNSTSGWCAHRSGWHALNVFSKSDAAALGTPYLHALSAQHACLEAPHNPQCMPLCSIRHALGQ